MVELQSLVPALADHELVPHGRARLTRGEERVLIRRVLQTDGRPAGVDDHGHLTAVGLTIGALPFRGPEHPWLQDRAGASVDGGVVRDRDVRRVERQAPHGDLLLRDGADAGDGHTVLRRDGVALTVLTVLPAHELGVEALRGINIGGCQVQPQRHAWLRLHSGH